MGQRQDSPSTMHLIYTQYTYSNNMHHRDMGAGAKMGIVNHTFTNPPTQQFFPSRHCSLVIRLQVTAQKMKKNFQAVTIFHQSLNEEPHKSKSLSLKFNLL